VSEWRSIASAPKDGTWILLTGGETTEDDYMDTGVYRRRPVSAFWNDNRWSFAFWDGDWRDDYSLPTHWMPLPELPK
jgi:hypothetical protein